MNYCAKYYSSISLSLFDEIIFPYESQPLSSLIQKYPNKKITLLITDIDTFYQSKAWNILNQYPIHCCFYEPCAFQPLSEQAQYCMKQLTIPYYCGYIATDYAQMRYLCEKGVSELYISDTLCFDLKRATAAIKRFQVKFRAFPNIAQSEIKETPFYLKFFIRPEDVKEYSEYIDTLEFYSPLDRQETLLNIYTKGVWFGDLKELILNLNTSIDSTRIFPSFAFARMNCNQQCLKGVSCFVCERIISLNNSLKNKGLIVKRRP